MGVHPNCPSSVVREGDEILLADLFKRHPELLADHEKGTVIHHIHPEIKAKGLQDGNFREGVGVSLGPEM